MDNNSPRTVTPSSGRGSKMQSLLNEFKSLYETRLKKVTEAEHHGEDVSQVRCSILLAYVEDLNEQNDVLVETIDDLEREANSRVEILQRKLSRTVGSEKELSLHCRRLQEQLQSGRFDIAKREAQLKELESENLLHEKQKLECDGHNLKLTSDVNEMIKLIARFQITGNFDINNTEFQTIDKTIFVSSNSLEDASLSDFKENRKSTNCNEDSKMLDGVELKLKNLGEEKNDLTQEYSNKVNHSEALIRKLKFKLEESENEKFQYLHDMEHYKHQFQQQEESYKLIKEEKHAMKDTLALLEASMESLKLSSKENRESQKKEITRYQLVIHQLEQQLVDLRQNEDKNCLQNENFVSEMLKEQEQHKLELVEMENDNACLQGRLEEQSLALADAERNKSELVSKLDCVSTSLRDARKSAEAKEQELQTEVSSSKSLIRRLERTAADFRSEVESLNWKCSEQEAVIARIASELEKEKSQNDEYLALIEKQQQDFKEKDEKVFKLEEEVEEKNKDLKKIEDHYCSVVKHNENKLSQEKMKCKDLMEKYNQIQTKFDYEFSETSGLRCRLLHLEEEIERKSLTIVELRKALSDSKCSQGIALQSIADKDLRMQGIEMDFDQTKSKMQEMNEQLGQTEAKLQASAMEWQRERDRLSVQLKNCQNMLNASQKQLEMEKKTAKEQMEIVSALQLQRREDSQMSAERSIESDESLQTIRQRLHDALNRNGSLSIEHEQLERHREELKEKLKAAEQQTEDTEKQILAKDGTIEKLQRGAHEAEIASKESAAKLAAREEAVLVLNSEVQRLKLQKQDKNREIKKLQGALSRQKEELESSRRLAAADVYERESLIKTLRGDLKRREMEYHTYYQKVLRYEEQIEKLRAQLDVEKEEAGLQKSEAQKLDESLSALEAELRVCQEKHRTCQQEVGERDIKILKLRSDVDNAQEQRLNVEEELRLATAEVEHVQCRLRDSQAEMDELNSELVSNKDKFVDDLRASRLRISVLETSEAEFKETKLQIKQLINDFNTERQRHQEQAEDGQLRIQQLQREIKNVSTELQQRDRTVFTLRENLSQVEQEREDAHGLYDSVKAELNQVSEELFGSRRLLNESEQKRITLEGQVEELEEENEKLKDRCEIHVGKTHQMAEEREKLEENLCRMHHSLNSSKLQEDENLILVQRFRNSLSQSEAKASTMRSELSSLEESLQHSNSELVSLQESLAESEQALLAERKEARSLREEVAGLKQQSFDLEELNGQLKSDLKCFEKDHHHSDEEFLRLKEELNQAGLDLDDNQADIHSKTRQLNDAQATVNDLKIQLAALREQKINAEKEASRHEACVHQLQLNLSSMHKKSKQSYSQLEEKLLCCEQKLQEKISCNNSLLERQTAAGNELEGLTLQLREVDRETKDKINEINCLHLRSSDLQSSVAQFKLSLDQSEARVSQLQNELHTCKRELIETQSRFKEVSQELAHHQERLRLTENSLATAQEELSQRNVQLVKEEQATRKVSVELKTVKERWQNNDVEIERQKKTIERLRKEVAENREEIQKATSESIKLRQECANFELNANFFVSQEKKLTQHIKKQDAILSQLQEKLKQEELKAKEISCLLSTSRGCEADLQEINRKLKQQAQVAESRMSEEISKSNNLNTEKHQIENVLLSLKDEILCLEGNCKIEKMKSEMAVKESFLQNQEIKRLENHVNHLNKEVLEQQEKYDQLSHKLAEESSEKSCLKLESAQISSQHSESSTKLTEKSRLLKQVTNSLDQQTAKNEALRQEIASYEQRFSTMHVEQGKLQNQINSMQQEVSEYQSRIGEMHADLEAANRQHRRTLADFSAREEECQLLKVQLAALHQRIEKQTAKIESLTLDLKDEKFFREECSAENGVLHKKLAASDDRTVRLEKESESVVANVNGWIQQQRAANQKLSNKIRQQSDAIVTLSTEKDSLRGKLEKQTQQLEMQQDKQQREQHKEQKLLLLEKQLHNQKIELQKTRNKLETNERENCRELREKNQLVQDLQGRVKESVEAVSNFTKQLSMSQKENVEMQFELEKLKSSQETWRLEAEVKQQTISSLRSKLEKSSENLTMNSMLASLPPHVVY